ncbi:MAG: (4Fe-4S)-binding protein [Thermoanaerobaculia bacterium]|nr:(4Fe-4S)-binding protein [Thermoanaerobaculia bacterium]MBP9822968.1 (4Fe-4S)-binding protein [Thermoanaerobaculia bacterium]
MKRIQTYPAAGITVTFDPNVCEHSGVCLKALPAVFDVRRRRWVAADAASPAEVAAAIDRCPSGALRYVLEPATESKPAVELPEPSDNDPNG